MPVFLLASLGRQGSRCSGGAGFAVGVYSSVSYSSFVAGTGHSPFILSPVHQGESAGVGGSVSVAHRCNRASVPDSAVLQPHVRGDQGVQRVEAHHRPLLSEQLCGENPLLHGDHPVGSSVHSAERLDGFGIHEGCLPSGSYSSFKSQIPAVCGGGQNLAVSGSCFGFTMAPQVFTRVMALVSAFLQRMGVQILRYQDDWLDLASSREGAIWVRDQVLDLCQTLGIVVNLEKSSLSPAQSVDYLGARIDSQTFQASPTPLRTEKFVSSREQFAKSLRVLLGHLASPIHLVPAVKAYRSMLSVVFAFRLPSLSEDPSLRTLIRSFAIECLVLLGSSVLRLG